MKSSNCRDVEELIRGSHKGMNEAARLRLEQHLEECTDCRQDLSISRATRDLFVDTSPMLSDAARARALSRALSRADSGKVASMHPSPRHRLLALGMVSAAAAAGLTIWLGGRAEPEPQSLARAPIAAPRTQEPAGGPAAATTSVEGGFQDVESPQSMRFAHAKVDVSAGSRLKFDPESAVLTLERGRVDVDVDPSLEAPFSVHTQRFRVQVLGTMFSVTPDEVSVREGHVQISDHEGRMLARDLAAGSTFSMHVEASKPAASTRSDEARAHKSEASAQLVLSQARKALGNAQTSVCTQLLDSLSSASLSRAQQAEAATLRAEVALMNRDIKGALEQYEALAKRFRGLSAGENAAFAAAQLSPRANPSREKDLLETYLARYPRGRFADEVAAKLSKLGAR